MESTGCAIGFATVICDEPARGDGVRVSSVVREFTSSPLPDTVRPGCMYGPVLCAIRGDSSSMSNDVSGTSSTGLTAFSGVTGREPVPLRPRVRRDSGLPERSFSKERACVTRWAMLLLFWRTRAVAMRTESATGCSVLGAVLS